MNSTQKIKQENLAANFCGLLAAQGITDSAIEWRILGQETDGSLLASWISIGQFYDNDENEIKETQKSHIGLYDARNKRFEILHRFAGRENIIQASMNSTKTLLIYVIKNNINQQWFYQPYIIELKNSTGTADNEHASPPESHPLLQMPRTKQVLVQFLWRKQSTFEKYYQDKFLVMCHEENILLFTSQLCKIESPMDDPHNTNSLIIDFKKFNTWYLNRKNLSNEIIVRNFTWAQWDSNIQALYFINVKEKIGRSSLLEKDDDDDDVDNKLFNNPKLSAYQFHEDSPRETVLNIPLNLPKLPPSNSSNYIPIYEDDTVPLRIHDSSLNLMIITDDNVGMLFVCHYYLYQPMKKSDPDDDDLDDEFGSNKSSNDKENENNVHFAYSVTILHHGCVIHCVIPGISWNRAKLMKPTFKLQGDHHMIIYQPDLFVHLLDVGIQHEPCCHIISGPIIKNKTQQQQQQQQQQPIITYLVPWGSKWGSSLCYDSATLDLISINIPKSHLIETFRQDTSLDNRLSIIHYFLIHGHEEYPRYRSSSSSSATSSATSTNTNYDDIFCELMEIILQNPINSDTVPLLKEMLIAGVYETTRKNVSSQLETIPLLRLIPLTTICVGKTIHAKIQCPRNPQHHQFTHVGLSHEQLYNTTMMLLSPQQRLSPYRTDIWTRLWSHLNDNKEKIRFTLDQVMEKLILSLECYHPEALSKCTTPTMSPMGIIPSSTINFNDFSSRNRTNHQQLQNDILPFIEFETCTATKQELINSVNLRELSLHLVKHTQQCNNVTNGNGGVGGFRWLNNFRTNMKSNGNVPPPTPTFIHTVAAQFVAAQLELSRKVCVLACRYGLNINNNNIFGGDFTTLRNENVRGFHLIDCFMTAGQQYNLYQTLERYQLACDSMGFPMPHGFSSFFTYLGYRTLTFDMFMQYVTRNVFELQIDVLRAIFLDIDDVRTKDGVSKKIQLLCRLPRSRAKRLLNNWTHPYSLMIRGREHSNSILSGNPISALQSKSNNQQHHHDHDRRRKSSITKWPIKSSNDGDGDDDGGKTEQIKDKKLINNDRDRDDDGRVDGSTDHHSIGFMANDKLSSSPLDTFFNLLTAKANLNELDFNLLIENVMTSLDDFNI